MSAGSAGINIKVEIDDSKFRSVIRELQLKGKDIRPALKRSAAYMYGSFDRNFKSGGRPSRWPSLSPNTILKRRKGSSLPLMDSGMMRLSVLARTGKGSLFQLRKTSLKMGTTMQYASYHQEGTSPRTIFPKGKALKFPTAQGIKYARLVRHPGIPKRPFVMIQKEDVEEITNIFSTFLTG